MCQPVKCSYQPGDILYVRETWRPVNANITYDGRAIDYAADWNPEYFKNSRKITACNGGKWKPSIHMPRKAARIFLEVKNVRVERLQDITEDDAVKEGFEAGYYSSGDGKFEDVLEHEWTAKDEFHMLWNELNTKRGYGWDTNPWVWVIEFEVKEAES